MNLTKILAVALAIVGLIGCGSDSDSTPAKEEAKTEPTSREAYCKDKADDIIFNKSYKGTVSATTDEAIKCYKLSTAKANQEYYFHLKNIGESFKTTNYAYTKVAYTISDDSEDLVAKTTLSTVTAERSYNFTAKTDGNLYITFDSNYTLGNYNSRYEFDVKTGLEDEGFKHDVNTFEFNDFKKVAYPIEMNKTYKSSAIGTKDPNDWYVLENMDASKEYHLHLINLGDRNENPSSNEVQCIIWDEDSKVKDIKLATPTKEKSYSFSPIKDGKVYLQFYTHRFGAIYGNSRYEFDVK